MGLNVGLEMEFGLELMGGRTGNPKTRGTSSSQLPGYLMRYWSVVPMERTHATPVREHKMDRRLVEAAESEIRLSFRWNVLVN